MEMVGTISSVTASLLSDRVSARPLGTIPTIQGPPGCLLPLLVVLGPLQLRDTAFNQNGTVFVPVIITASQLHSPTLRYLWIGFTGDPSVLNLCSEDFEDDDDWVVSDAITAILNDVADDESKLLCAEIILCPRDVSSGSGGDDDCGKTAVLAIVSAFNQREESR
ncbi:hypothetical protein DFS33DRAFT_1274568 [Desarmillaria ectypa]|nr:hypothetical protein DFS33DRAFT_1274568 [Desarmillaria ectypa]